VRCLLLPAGGGYGHRPHARLSGAVRPRRKDRIDLDGESAGLLPSRDWKQRRFKQTWYPGETVIAGIGQGYHLTTPLQLATAAAMLANGGKRIEPRLVQAVRDPLTHAWLPQPDVVRGQMAITPEHLAVVREGMMDVMRPAHGVGSSSRRPYAIAARPHCPGVGIKQGARYEAASCPASIVTMRCSLLCTGRKPHHRGGGDGREWRHGGSTAAPVARAVFDYYLTGKRPGAMKLEANEPQSSHWIMRGLRHLDGILLTLVLLLLGISLAVVASASDRAGAHQWSPDQHRAGAGGDGGDGQRAAASAVQGGRPVRGGVVLLIGWRCSAKSATARGAG